MKSLSSYIIKESRIFEESHIFEDDMRDIVDKNLAEISDEIITTELSDYIDTRNISQEDIINTWNELKAKLKNKSQDWIVQPCADIDEYNGRCKKWALQTIKKYNITKVPGLEKILIGIAWVVNGI